MVNLEWGAGEEDRMADGEVFWTEHIHHMS